MTAGTSPQKPTLAYSAPTIALHWLTLGLLACVYAAIELRELFPKGSDIREGFKSWHFMLGLLVLIVVLVRIVVRATSGTPPITPAPPRLQLLAGRVVHFALYVLMLGMPLAGWAILSAAGKPIPFFGLELPALFAPDKALAGQIKEWHTTAGTVGYWLIGFHAAAGLFHHYVMKDDTLRRMLPGRNRG